MSKCYMLGVEEWDKATTGTQYFFSVLDERVH